jgi:hypothetical protein
VMLT